MSLRVVSRKGSAYLWLTGTVRGHRVRESTGTADVATAETIRAAREARLHEDAIFGRSPTVPFRAAIDSYLAHQPRGYSQRVIVGKLRQVLGNRPTRDLKPSAKASTVIRHVTSPISAILQHAEMRGWCGRPRLDWPKVQRVRPEVFMPAQAEALQAAAAPHIAVIIGFLFCTGARLGEALHLDWTDVDLLGQRCVFWEGRTKTGARRVVQLMPRAVALLAALPGREGRVFRRDDGQPYALREGHGGAIRQAWIGACARAGLPGEAAPDDGTHRRGIGRKFRPIHTPHDCRHTWASWHYALWKDLLRLKIDGGWQKAATVEVYAHLIPAGHEAAIRLYWGLPALRGTQLTQRPQPTRKIAG